MTAVITCDNLTRRYDDLIAVDQLTLAVEPGEILGLLGHNGAGKTTTIRLLNGLLKPNGGHSRVFGFDPASDGPAVRRRTGVLTETPSLDDRLTARDSLTIHADIYDVPQGEVAGRVTQILASFELLDRADEKVGNYSKGMKQRLALARAFLHQPDLLFLDEPTAGLDPVASRQVHSLINRLSHEEQRTIILCTHNLIEAQQLCDRVAVLEHGKLVALGTPAELARHLGRSQRLKLEVAPDSVETVRAVLAPRTEISLTAPPDGLLTLTGISREMTPQLISDLTAAGVRIYQITPDEPSLEDVYFALHDHQEAAP